MTRARTLLVGGNDSFLDGVVDWVARDAQLEVAGKAHSGAEAIERVAARNVDLVVMDVTLTDMSGFEAARRIKTQANAPLVVLLSFHDSHAARLEAWAAGADGFVATSEITECLTPLVGELLRQRDSSTGATGSVIPFKRVPPADVSE